MNKNNNSSTAEQILDVAQDLLQRNGYNGFSYKDIAERVDIRKASIHYHFPSKSDLVIRLCERYVNQFIDRLHQLDQKYDSRLQRIQELTRFFARIIKDKEKLCPVAMLSAEVEALPAGAKSHLQRFIGETELWLGQTLKDGQNNQELGFNGSSQSQSRILLATLQGAMLMARASGEKAHFQNIADDLISQLQPDSAMVTV
jgi:TetR/AcrR family transcriptional repressor of nem operon